jgi:hypothetical protein
VSNPNIAVRYAICTTTATMTLGKAVKSHKAAIEEGDTEGNQLRKV